MPSRFPQSDLSRLRRISIGERGGKVTIGDFVKPYEPGPEVEAFLDVVPGLLAGAAFKSAIGSVVRSALSGKTVLLMFGAHVVKCGLSRLVIDLMERRAVSALATSGAGAIHDFEIAMWGTTSEDVRENLRDGSFGMCRETADLMNEAAAVGRREGWGFGESLGWMLAQRRAVNMDASIIGRALELGIPATVHVALGTDVIHQHPSADGAALGETSLADFRILSGIAGRLGGGTVLLIGSAVVLPEVFLKAVSVARNLGEEARGFTAVGMDMNEPYRMVENVLGRPTEESGVGIVLRGRHELLLPLLWLGVVRGLTAGQG